MFSVVIPCHNDVDILALVLAGLTLQSASLDHEVILVDNNSTGGEIDALYQRYLGKLQLTLIRQPQLPHPMAQSRARNLGLKVAKYEWIVNLDADSVPSPSYLDALHQFISSSPQPKSILTGIREFIAKEGLSEQDVRERRVQLQSLPRVASPSNYGRLVDRRVPQIYEIARTAHPWTYIHGCNCAYRREDALAIGGYDEIYDGSWGYEDTDFAYRMITAGAAPGYVPGMDCFHLDSTASAAVNRADKRGNVNWKTLISRIPGYESHRTAQYELLDANIST